MLRILQPGNAQPYQGIVDPSATFLPGMIAEHKILGNQIVVGVSSGLRPIGIIDDIKTSTFSSNSIDEIKISSVINPDTDSLGRLVTPIDITVCLDNSNIIPKSFISSPIKLNLKPKNGVVIVPAGTPLNNDLSGSGIPDSIYFRCSYTFQIPNMPGVDTTAGSNRVTFWYDRIIAQTDQFDTYASSYPLGSPLFVNESGLLTTRRITDKHPAVATCWGPPSLSNPFLEFMWL